MNKYNGSSTMRRDVTKNIDGALRMEGAIYRVQVLDRAFAILDVLAGSDSSMAVIEVSKALQLHKSTVHRLLAVLESHGYVERNPTNAKYGLGSKLFELGSRAIAKLDLLGTVKPFLERVVAETGETAHIGILQQGDVISLANVESPRTLRTPATVGKRTPAHCTSIGKVILAFAPDSEADSFIKTYGLKAYTRNTITDPEKFKSSLRRARTNGYALDNEEYEDGLKCAAAPVRDHSGRVIAALSVTGPGSRLGKGRMKLLVSSIIKAAADLSTALNYNVNGHETRKRSRSSPTA